MTIGSMTREVAARKRGQLVRDGYCHIEGVLPEDFLTVIGEESDRRGPRSHHEPPTGRQVRGYANPRKVPGVAP